MSAYILQNILDRINDIPQARQDLDNQVASILSDVQKYSAAYNIQSTGLQLLQTGYYSGVTPDQTALLSALTSGLNTITTISEYTIADTINSGTATAAQVLSGATFSNSGQNNIAGTMAIYSGTNVIPTTTNHTLPGGYYTGVFVSGDANLLATHIKSGIVIFGVTGTA